MNRCTDVSRHYLTHYFCSFPWRCCKQFIRIYHAVILVSFCKFFFMYVVIVSFKSLTFSGHRVHVIVWAFPISYYLLHSLKPWLRFALLLNMRLLVCTASHRIGLPENIFTVLRNSIPQLANILNFCRPGLLPNRFHHVLFINVPLLLLSSFLPQRRTHSQYFNSFRSNLSFQFYSLVSFDFCTPQPHLFLCHRHG